MLGSYALALPSIFTEIYYAYFLSMPYLSNIVLYIF